MGDISVVMTIQVTGGPVVQVRLCAVLTVPAVTVSTDTLEFDNVQCGMCQMRTVQLVNHESVPCYWSIAEEVKPFKKVDKFLPLYERKKVLQERRPPPVVFEMIPSSGLLSPGERVNVQIKFSPAEEHVYSRQLVFYSLELDTQYLEEEKILRLMQGYDENNRLLLPPRVPGESLPQELLDYYTEHCSQLKNDAELKEDLDEKENGTDEEKRTNESEEEMHTTSVKPAEQLVSEMTKEGSSERLGQLEMTPVSRAIARHMCIDLSPEGLAARNRRGIAIIVYGAPLIDKGSTAAALARHYSGACLSVDAVVTDVLMNGTSPVSLTARQIFDSAAAQYAERIAEQATEEITDLGPAADLKASDPAPKSNPAPHHNVEELPKPSKDSCSTNNSKEAPQQSESGGDVTSLRNLLPEQLLVDILAERLQLKDCYRGIVIGSLESVYTQSVASTLQVVLKALNNRKHIYVVNLSDSYAALKARERAQRETEEALEKEKAEREEKWLQELDDEEYDALPEEEKERIVHWHREKLRQKKLRLREEELKKKSKKAGKSSLDSKELLRKRSLLEGKQSSEALNRQRTSPCNTSKESLADVREQQNSNEVHHGKQSEQIPALHAGSPQPIEKLEREKSTVDELQSQFSVYEQSQEQVEHILRHWDRAQGSLLVPLPSEEGSEEVVMEKQTPPVGKRSKKANSKILSPMPSATAVPVEAGKSGDEVSLQYVIPHLVLNVTSKDYPSATEMLKGSILPPLDDVLDNLGLGPSGPPIPPPTTFSIVPFPKNREQSKSQLSCDCFTFLVPSGQDEDEEKKDSGENLQASVGKEGAAVTPSKTRSKSSRESAVTKEQEKKSRESQRTKKRTLLRVSSTSDCSKSTQDQHQETLELIRKQSLTKFRWVIPANDEVVLRIWFYTDSPGKFEQTFSFELLGTQRQYQLLCRGVCTYPSICKDYRTLFALSKRAPRMEEGIQKTYLIKPGCFEFRTVTLWQEQRQIQGK
ncbi:Hydrocephalus-inducing protein Hy-3 [Larimichthys crocea]|uniref:Hydrocephalus-inducing protein Hy-3 n=1 Tax=Larimichthys crocea TaxID=215358 RepID=A0A6G0IWR8_LARCR|nr:Hydrocephalus-inducing protein Hy-3 [Larimichthys crocea]